MTTWPIIAKRKLSLMRHRRLMPMKVRKMPIETPVRRPHFSRTVTAGKFMGMKIIMELMGRKFIENRLTP